MIKNNNHTTQYGQQQNTNPIPYKVWIFRGGFAISLVVVSVAAMVSIVIKNQTPNIYDRLDKHNTRLLISAQNFTLDNIDNQDDLAAQFAREKAQQRQINQLESKPYTDKKQKAQQEIDDMQHACKNRQQKITDFVAKTQQIIAEKKTQSSSQIQKSEASANTKIQLLTNQHLQYVEQHNIEVAQSINSNS